MSHQAIEAVLNHSQSKGSTRLLLITVAHHIQDGAAQCQVAKEVLCGQTGIDFRSIGRMLATLKDLKEIEVVHGGGKNANTYSLSPLLEKATASQQEAPPRRRRGLGTLQKYRSNEKYRLWRADVLERDGYICRKCGESKDVCAHHIKPFAQFPELRFEVSNGISLCQQCHNEIEGDELDHAPSLLELIQ